MRFGRRHHLVFVFAHDAEPRLAFLKVPRDDGAYAVDFGGCTLGGIQAQVGLARFGIKAVACKTFV